MIDIIQANPYRILGIYSNSPTKERVANNNRLKAFLKVGKALTFPLDLSNLMPPVSRTSETVATADANLKLPNDQLKYAQFWFVKATPIDDIAMNNLIAGNIDKTILILEKKEDASSLQNRIVCALMKDDYKSAVLYAERLYPKYSQEFANLVLGMNNIVDTDKLEYAFLDELCSALGEQKVLPSISNSDWKQYVGNKAVKPLIDSLLSAIDTAKLSKGKGPNARLNAGTKLMNDTMPMLEQLRKLIPVTDLQNQMIVDKVGIEILQCGIEYYNKSEEQDAAYKAMKLQSYALSIVVGKMAKDRCQENVNIMQKNIDSLPPQEVFAEDKAIREELLKFCKLPDKIRYSLTLLNNTKPHLQSMKQKLGANNAFYLKLSTQVVGNALHNLIEEINAVQDTKALRNIEYKLNIESTLKEAWKATEIMDTFDMESEFRSNRYNPNRAKLKDMCDKLGVNDSILKKVIVGLICSGFAAAVGAGIACTFDFGDTGIVVCAIIAFIIAAISYIRDEINK
ncbi:MAG: hypothetical protein LUC88_06725 [Prevotella sp.]|nr:hypothetical protein [Prevotella sp.]